MLRLNSSTKKVICSAAILLAVSQLIFWTFLGVAEWLARPQADPGPAEIEMYFRSDDGERLSETPHMVPLNADPAYRYLDDDRHQGAWFVHRFQYAETDPDFGVFLGFSRRIVDVRLNGVPLKTQSPTDIWGILGGFESIVYSFPEEYMQAGENTLELLNSGLSVKVAPPFFVGDLETLYRAHSWSRIFSIDLTLVAIGVMLFAMLLCVLIDWPAESRIRINALLLLLGAWSLRNLTFVGIDEGLPDPFRQLSHYYVTYLFLLGFLMFALGWTRRPLWAFKLTAALFVLACVCSSVTELLYSDYTVFLVSFFIETALTLAIGIAALLMFADFWVKNGKRETIEILLFLVCLSAVVVDAIDDRWAISIPFVPDLYLTFYSAPMCGLLLALGMVASLAAQSTRARIATENVNELLNTRLSEQEAQLTESYEREKNLERQRILADERQRMTRDMHDGVGGSMMSLLLQAKRKELDNVQLVQSLQASMNDLRLIIDSFDHVGDNLEYALGAFRERIEPELKARGVQLQYETSAAGTISGFGPESVLQIYRILQEACNNAVNHGAASLIDIRLSSDEEDRTVSIAVRDNGTGFSIENTRHGRGLGNMQHRAERLAGNVSITSDQAGDGARVELTFPMRTAKLAGF